MKFAKNTLFVLGLIVPISLTLRALFFPGPAVWGDAPYFYPEGLKQLVAEPSIWTSRGNNFGGPNNLLWISPLMLVYGLLNKLFGMENDGIIRILFYFPSVALAFITPIIFVKRLGYSRVVQFFTSLLYGLNTYFLLLIDGGQVGVALAYGLFPLALFSIRRLLKEPSFLGFFLALLLLFLITVADPRFAAITVFAALLWGVIEWFVLRKADGIKNLKFLNTLLFANILLSAYWLIPLSRLSAETLSVDVSRLQLLSLLNPLFLFQPHWPLNEFGKISPPPFYFALLPVLIFGSLFTRKGSKGSVFAFCFLLFAFLTKGGSPPLGDWYNWLVIHSPFGFAFRDSTKFFAPTFLFAGILVGMSAESLGKIARYMVVFTGLIFIYLLFLVHPALLGNLNGVLSGRDFTQDYNLIHQKLRGDPQFFRTAWFPERHPFAFFTNDNPALDAKQLVEVRPFASLNVGTLDAFNFLHNDQYLDWFDLLGIKYLAFSGDPRRVSLNEEEKEDWGTLLNLVAGKNELEQVGWGTTFPIYKAPTTKPHVFSVNKLIAVIGGDDIYQKIKDVNSNFSIGNQGFAFFEDGKFNPRSLQDLPKDSVVLAFNGKDETDLAMSLLQEYFVAPEESLTSEWAIRKPNDYLRYKYEFLVKGVDTKEFDYSKGIAFSSVRGEKISWNLPVPYSGDYILAVRTLGSESMFSWNISDIYAEKGAYPLMVTNDNDFEAVNVVALVPKEAWEKTQELARNFIDQFEVVTLNEPSGIDRLISLTEDGKWREVRHEAISSARYKATVSESARWIVFTDTYDKGWKLTKGEEVADSIPFYSMVNGFYSRPSSREAEIVFEGQKNVRWGLYSSALSFLVLLIVFLWFYSKRSRQ